MTDRSAATDESLTQESLSRFVTRGKFSEVARDEEKRV
jgi:hypothetical protein